MNNSVIIEFIGILCLSIGLAIAVMASIFNIVSNNRKISRKVEIIISIVMCTFMISGGIIISFSECILK